ncbi:MAG: S-layer homology domain-containing protein, partial [Bacillota bacterium]
KAMGLEDEAEDMMDEDLPYSDEREIPDDKIGYVALALERGIMMGDGNAFRPNAPIRRCEVAAVLDRLQEALPPLGYEVRGVISGVNESGNSITVRVYDSKWWNWQTTLRKSYTGSLFTTTVTIRVSDDALILLNKSLAEIHDLEAGYRVTVLRNSSGQAVLVDAQSNGVTPNWPDSGVVTKEGEVKEIDTGSTPEITIEDSDGDEWTYRIASNCVVQKDGDEIDLDDVEVGDDVTLRIVDSKVTKIVVEDEVVESEKDGEVTDLRLTSSPKRITIKLSNGSSFTAAISSSVVVKEDGDTVDLDDIKVGDEVHLELRDGYVVRIEIEESAAQQYEGTVIDIYTSGSSKRIRLRLDDDRTMSATISSSVVVKYDGSTASLSDVRDGDEVTITVEDSVVTRIDISERAVTEREGVVTQVETGANARIWIRVSSSSVESYAVASSVDIDYEDDELDLEDIVPGDEVELKISDSKVTDITVTDRPESEVEGTIEALNPSSTSGRTISVENSSGRDVTYKVSGDVTIKKGAHTLSFSELEEGDEVTLKLAGNLVVQITVEE